MNRKAISSAFNVATIKDGVSSAIVEVSLATLLYDADANGASTSSQEFYVTYKLKVGDDTILPQDITSVTIVTPNGISIKQNTQTNNECTFVVSQGASPSGVIGITMDVTKNGNQYTPYASISVAANVRGETGARGRVGRFFYYGGEFNDQNNTDLFEVNDAQAPFFKHIDPDNNEVLYHVFNYEVNGSYTMSDMWWNKTTRTGTPPQPSFNNKPWEAMTNDFKYLITDAIFGDFAHFGSAIISGDWMISQHGTWGGNTTLDYTYFDPEYPNESVYTEHTTGGRTWTGYNFVPSYALDMLNGTTYQHDGVFSGFVKKKKTIITNANYTHYMDFGQFGAVLDLDECGTFVEVQFDPEEGYDMPLPLISKNLDDSQHFSQEYKDMVRSFVGNDLLIYNTSGRDISVKYKDSTTQSGSYVSFATTISHNTCAQFTCTLGSDYYGYEVIYWALVSQSRII